MLFLGGFSFKSGSARCAFSAVLCSWPVARTGEIMRLRGRVAVSDIVPSLLPHPLVVDLDLWHKILPPARAQHGRNAADLCSVLID